MCPRRPRRVGGRKKTTLDCPDLTLALDCSLRTTCMIRLTQWMFVGLEVRRKVRSRMRIHRAFMDHSAGNCQWHSKACGVYLIIWGGAVVGEQKHAFSIAGPDRTYEWGGVFVIGEIKCGSFTKLKPKWEACWLTRKRIGIRAHWRRILLGVSLIAFQK